MSRQYNLVEEDSVRTFRCRLVSNHIPTEATLVLVKGSARLEFELENVDDIWQYPFEDEDFEELTNGTWKGQVHAIFSDGSFGTYPTTTLINVKVYKKL
jgi:hypothetical protein